MNGELECGELLSRYAVEKSYYRSDASVRHNAFVPANDGATSVFRTSGLSDPEIWAIGQQNVAERRGKPLLGRIQILTAKVLAENLQVRPEEPPPRHANIVGWPDERAKQKEIALRLAAKAEFFQAPARI